MLRRQMPKFLLYLLYVEAGSSNTALSQMEKRAVMAEIMLEAKKQYQAGEVKANQSFTSSYVLLATFFSFQA